MSEKPKVKHLVTFSGGACSWAAAKRVVAKHGPARLGLLFADTYIEDDDLYRFLVEATANILSYPIPSGLLPLSIPPLESMPERKAFLDSLNIPGLTRIADGRTPWEVMRDHNCIAKPRMDMCSRELKREMLDEWRDSNLDPSGVVHIGISWDESHRLERVRTLCAPWQYEAPMCEPPYLSKEQILNWMKREGIQPPRLYALGFPHNNCGGFCIKAGQGHFAHLLKELPERYAYHEAKEEEMRQVVGDYSILRDRTGGTTKTLSLAALRKRIENKAHDKTEWGGCGCALE